MKCKILFVLILVMPLSACSTFGFFYDHLPFFATWRIDSMFDLNDQQEEQVEKSTKEIKSWLSQEAFPALIADLEKAKALWQEERFKEASHYFDQQTQVFVGNFLGAVSPHLVALLLTLDEENTREYIAYNLERSEEWFDYAQTTKKKVASRIERLENWFGSLSEKQEARVSEIATLIPQEQEIRSRNNEYWVGKVVNASLTRNEFALSAWLKDTSVWWHPDYKRLREQNRVQTLALIDMMIETMSSEQQQHVIDVVEEWINKLEELD